MPEDTAHLKVRQMIYLTSQFEGEMVPRRKWRADHVGALQQEHLR